MECCWLNTLFKKHFESPHGPFGTRAAFYFPEKFSRDCTRMYGVTVKRDRFQNILKISLTVRRIPSTTSGENH